MENEKTFNPLLKAAWVKALRDGLADGTKFNQTQYELVKDGRYCCFGVLCEIMGVPKRPWGSEGWGFEDLNGFVYRGTFPCRIAQEIGLTENEHFHLISMNDSGDSFKKIAAYIEKNL